MSESSLVYGFKMHAKFSLEVHIFNIKYALKHRTICRHQVISVLCVKIFSSIIILYGMIILSMKSKPGSCTSYALLQAPGVLSARGETSYTHIAAPTPGKLCYKMRSTGWLLLLRMSSVDSSPAAASCDTWAFFPL